MSRMQLALSVLGPASEQIDATFLRQEGCALDVLCGFPVARGTMIQVEMDDTLVLGRVTACSPRAGSYELHLDVHHSLPAPRCPDSEWLLVRDELWFTSSLGVLQTALHGAR